MLGKSINIRKMRENAEKEIQMHDTEKNTGKKNMYCLKIGGRKEMQGKYDIKIEGWKGEKRRKKSRGKCKK